MPYTVPKLKDFSPAALNKAAEKLLAALEKESAAVKNEATWKDFRDRWMARKDGVLTQVNEWLKSAPRESKRDVGQRVNQLKTAVEQTVDAAQQRLQNRAAESRLTAERVDITLPGIRRPLGAEHPVIKTMNEIVCRLPQSRLLRRRRPGDRDRLLQLRVAELSAEPSRARHTGYSVHRRQESKPQRDRLLLRTHTSPVQIRTMEKMKPPLRIVIPGKVHRNDPPDASHSPMFHQVEGLAVDTNITFGDLKGTLDHAMKMLFGSSVKTSFRPSFFPFTEPSAEMMVSCFICGGSGKRGSDNAPCRPCKQTGWIEILGCGMVDPNVFGFVKHNGYDPKKVSGFAFGMGADRIALLKYGVDDIQLFFNGDVRFLEQFGASR